jgi:hypothetical protein
MPIFYFDSASFLTARALYTNSNLTLPAADGWYSSCGYARQVSSGILGPLINCSDISAGCVVPCQSDPPLTISPLVNTRGVFDTQVDVSQKVGAIRVEMDISGTNTIVGFFCQLGGDTYPNSLNRRQFKVRQGFGVLQKPYVIGSGGDTCNASGNTVSVPWFKRNSAGGWTSQPTTVTEYITGSDTVAATTTLVMFVPKPNPVPSILSARIIQPCTVFNNNTMRIFCPEPLLAVNCSSVSTTATGGTDPACPKALTKPLYHGKVSGTTSFAVSDWVFSDANSVNIPADGYYKTAYVSGSQNQWIQVAGGIVTTIGLCP